MIRSQQISIIDAFIALFKLLPPTVQKELKEELTLEKSHGKVIRKNERKQNNEFQKYLLSWPRMSDKEYNYINEKRKHFNQWK